jgi:hypothetical protein
MKTANLGVTMETLAPTATLRTHLVRLFLIECHRVGSMFYSFPLFFSLFLFVGCSESSNYHHQDETVRDVVKQPKLCRDFNNGECKYDPCRFLHIAVDCPNYGCDDKCCFRHGAESSSSSSSEELEESEQYYDNEPFDFGNYSRLD